MISLILVAALIATPSQGIAVDTGQHGHPLRNDRNGLLEVNADFFNMAAETGGDFYFWAPGEFANAGVHIPIPYEAVALAYGNLDGSRRFTVPVESGARTLTIFSGAQRKDRIVLVRPDGSIVADGSPGIAMQSFSHMLIATVVAPAAGTWRLEFAGAGKFSMSAHVKAAADDAAPDFIAFRFVEMGGRPGHEGWFPIDRELKKGETIECSAVVSGRVTALQFAFVTRDEQPMSTVYLQQEEGPDSDYYGRCLIPDRPFRIVVSGQDERGMPFRRTESGMRTPQ
jgi:hypothetical protein